MPPQILVVEDDRDIADLLVLHLRDAGYDVDSRDDGIRAWQSLKSKSYDLVVLDVMLPGLDGLEICRRLRAQPSYPLILMLTSKGTELDRVLGLELGADDYLTKPFSIRELLARVKALLRRYEVLESREAEAISEGRGESGARAAKDTTLIRCGELTVEVEKRKVTLAGEVVNLTAKEFDLLHQFAAHPGRVYTRSQLLNSVWGMGFEGYEHTVNSHINRLRSKIERDPAHPQYLLTVWGVGYKFTDCVV